MSRRPAVLRARGMATLAAVTYVAMILAPSHVSGANKRRTVRKAHPRKAATSSARRGPAVTRVPAKGSRGIAELHVHVRRGDTFQGLLRANGVDAVEVDDWARAAAAVFDLGRLRPRRGLTLRFDRATRGLETVRYEIDDHALLLLRRTPDGIHAERNGLPYVTAVKGVARRIERGLREDAAAAGVPESVVAELADVFGWEFDLAGSLRHGAELRILYENIWQVGERIPQPGRVLGAEIVADGRSITAVYFEDADGQGGYYRPDGEPLLRELLRYPVEFTEITSEFSLMRRHPITRRRRPHLGVDLAAPFGAPVRAVADGTVQQAAWVAHLGRTIRLEHGGPLTTIYGHLSRFASGIEDGTHVIRGQVIGYVGASGLATGPHLHYAIERDGEHVDPLALTATLTARVPDGQRAAFERVKTSITRQLAQLTPVGVTPTVSRRPAE